MTEKEYLYLGYYVDTNNNFILKIGTTNDLNRRQKEHTRKYRQTREHTLAENAEFQYIWHLRLSRYNTHRYEDKNIEEWKLQNFGEYVRNDRFVFSEVPKTAKITIRKEYEISIKIPA